MNYKSNILLPSVNDPTPYPTAFINTIDTSLPLSNLTSSTQILIPLLPGVPYVLTLPLEELLVPKLSIRGKIPRPQNAWMLFRKDFTAGIKLLPMHDNKKLCVQEISSLASKSWKQQPPEVKQFFEILRMAAKETHNLHYPNYRYRPERKLKKNTPVDKKKVKRDPTQEENFSDSAPKKKKSFLQPTMETFTTII
ncbi:9263_t:CDS:2 [Funneliformis caledonium]|uniref:9263_t:CDS:1 n=1 Tax=Funneliformis caledonium TaxID=1117310 RepID=A0A9N8YQB8_9GLOM|nr:9263_t:CDS:2 [Funneliformis caledonium]